VQTDLEDAVVLVTGASGGIGLATTRALLAEKARVAMVDLDEGTLDRAASELAAGDRLLTCAADITDARQVDAAVAAAAGQWGRLTGVAHVAGANSKDDGAAVDVSPETFARLLAVNLAGTFHVSRSAIPHLLAAGGGTIVNVSSAGALPGIKNGGATAYNASKAGILGLTRSVASQYAEQNLRCVAICPGPIDTPMLVEARAKLGHAAITPPRTLQRAGRPEEVAAVITLLLSDLGSYVSGSTWAIDGNMTGY
jgi:meso-butanediol dehydrogenase/(S,S)-butanediol dehydrogenase/diacetyl reductase